MSNSIWHKKHVFVVDKNEQVVVKLDDGTYGIIWVWKDKPLQDVMLFGENGIKFIEEYCYIDDLITQADKAERLQKAVDLAVDALKEIKDGKIPVSLGIYMDINDVLDKITALDQKENQ